MAGSGKLGNMAKVAAIGAALSETLAVVAEPQKPVIIAIAAILVILSAGFALLDS